MSPIIASIKHHGESLPVPSDGIARPFANEHFEGSIFFVHRPSKKSENIVSRASMLHSSDHWEIQIQGRFKTRPDGQLCAGGQLPQMPFGMNHMFTSMCRMVLNDAAVKSSGGSETLCQPIMKCLRLFRSEHPVNLPVSHPASQGTWEWMGSESSGEWYPVHWRQAGFDTDHYYTFTFNSVFVDWDSWKVTNVPGFGSFGIKTFCGKQGCELKLFDDSDHCFFQLEFHAPSARKNICGTTWCEAYSESGLSNTSTVASLSDVVEGCECEWSASVSAFSDELDSGTFTIEEEEEDWNSAFSLREETSPSVPASISSKVNAFTWKVNPIGMRSI